MDVNKADNADIDYENKLEDDEQKIKKVLINSNESNFILKLYLSEEKNSIIFKLEKERTPSLIYITKMFYTDFNKYKPRFFAVDIEAQFSKLKNFIDNSDIHLKAKENYMKIIIQNKIDGYTIDFLLIKKIITQNKLNAILYEEILKSDKIIDSLNKEISKLTKELEIKTNVINDLKINVNNIKKNIKEINSNNKNSNNNISSNNNNLNKNKEIKNTNKKEEDEEKKEAQSDSNSSKKEKEKEIENKRYISNSQKHNKSKKKKFFYPNNTKQNTQPVNKSNEDNSIFCFENVEIIGNKKIFDLLVTFNLIMVLIILCLIGSIYSIQSNLEFEKAIEEEFMNKLSYLNTLNEYAEEQQNQRINYYNKEYSEDSLFDNERQKIYFKEEIINLVGNDIKDVDFIMKYKSSRDSKKFDVFYNICKDIEDNALLIKNNKGEKFVLLSKHIAKVLKNKKIGEHKGKQKYFSMYNIDKYDIYEYDFTGNLKEVYTTLIKTIGNFFKAEYDDEEFEIKFFGKIKEINAFELKYIK